MNPRHKGDLASWRVGELDCSGSSTTPYPVPSTQYASDPKPETRNPKPSSRRGISLTEILVVMIIIAILAAVSLAAFVGAFGRAREANTRALIEKVDRALNTHLNQWISRTQPGSPNVQVLNCDRVLAGGDIERAQVIARKRLYKEEFPQYFVVVNPNTNPPQVLADWDALDVNADGAFTAGVDQLPEELSAAALEYRQMLFQRVPDGNDNDGDSLVDEADEAPQELSQRLARHDPATASAECLYMILLRAARSGSSESDPENFPHSEVHDSDGDGLPELIDGWGNPLRFYRAPIFYDSPGVQKGAEPYAATTPETREEDQYDPNRTLLLSPWWVSNAPSDAATFQTALSYRVGVASPRVPLAFHVLADPTGGGSQAWNWDGAAGGAIATYDPAARAYKASPLIVSAGSDGLFGIYPTPDWMRNTAFLFLTTAGDRQLAAGAPKITQRFLSLFNAAIPPDPALRQELDLELDKHLDNISNYALRAQ